MPGGGSQGWALIARVVASFSQPVRLFIGHTLPAASCSLSAFLPSIDRPKPVLQVCLSLGNVSPHLVHSSKTHESRARMLRWKLAKARSNDVMALPASTCALAAGSVSSAAWTSAEGMMGARPHSGSGGSGGAR
jgi:hypothetical protein